MPTQIESNSVVASIAAQGNTGSPTRVNITVTRSDERRDFAVPNPVVRVKVAAANGYADAADATIAVAAGSVLVSTVTSGKELIVSTPVLASASGTLTINGAVVQGETVVVGPRTYVFTAQTGYAAGSNVAVNIMASTTKAQGTLTLATQPTVGDSMTIGDRTYVFVVAGTGNNPGEIALGANLAATKPLVVTAINGTDGWNTPNSKVTAATFASDVCTLTAIVGGVAGNAIVTTETFAAVGNVFNAATLGTTTAGVDCGAAAAVTALAAAIEDDALAVVSACDCPGDTVVVTALTAGAAGNALAKTETMANGDWDGSGVFLTGGADAAPGNVIVDVTSATTAPFDVLVSSAPFGPTISTPARLAVVHAAP
jgi:hypothetical protein